jgi:UrcA family protein
VQPQDGRAGINAMKAIRNGWLLILVLSLALPAVRASADERGPIRSKVVNYDDLDLTSAAGASALYRRLKLAAREVCMTADGDYGDPEVWLQCFHDALIGAVRDLGNARVIALYNREHGAGIPLAAAGHLPAGRVTLPGAGARPLAPRETCPPATPQARVGRSGPRSPDPEPHGGCPGARARLSRC